jgi:hypothetical protein
VSRFRASVAVAAAVIAAAGSIVLSAPPAIAGPPPESLTVLKTLPIAVTSSSGKHLLLDVGAIRFSHNSSNSDAHSKGTVTLTLSKLTRTESHAWTFNLAADSFSTAADGSGKLDTGQQLGSFGQLNLTISPSTAGATKQCDTANFDVRHAVALKGPLKLATQSTGPHKWGTVNDRHFKIKGLLSGGHGPDNEEACTPEPPCVAGITWTANQAEVTLLGSDVAAKGKHDISRIVGTRTHPISTPAHALRVDTIRTTAPAPTLAKVGGHETLDATASSGNSSGSATLTSSGHSPYAQSCRTGQEKGTLWNAGYAANDPPLALTENIFGTMSIDQDKGADFIKFHLA